jgi:4-amino-4-deoxy-L-arabinose transferase-like glycosyltransferase
MAFFLILITLLLLIVIATQPIKNYDSISYHLPQMVKFYQDGKFSMLKQYRGMVGRYPYGWEALCTLFLFPFNGDFLVSLPNLIAWVLFGLSVYLLATNLGTKKIHAWAAVLMVLTIPLFIQNVNTLHVDLPFAAFFLASLVIAFEYTQTRVPTYLGLFLASLGMVLGIKGSGVVYGLLLIGVLVIGSRLNAKNIHQQHVSWGNRIKKFCQIGAGGFFVFLSCFWYIRNLVELGNPLGPFEIKLGNILLFPGKIKGGILYKSTLANLFQISNKKHLDVIFRQIKVKLGIPFFIMIVTILFYFILAVIKKRITRDHNKIILMVILLLTLLLYCYTPFSGSVPIQKYLITPWMGQAMRYALPFFGILAAIMASTLSHLVKRDITVVAIAIIGGLPSLLELANNNIGTKDYEIFFLLAFLLLVFSLFPLRGTRKTKQIRQFSLGFTILVLLTMSFAGKFIRDKNIAKSYGNVVDFLETRIEANEPIGIIDRNRSYPFYGKRLNRKIFWVPARKKSLPEWLRELQEKNISIIAAYITSKRPELAWLNDPEGPFIRILRDKPNRRYALYQMRRIEQ